MGNKLAPRNKKVKGSKKGKRFTQDQIDEMLFWWVFCDENPYRAAQIISQKFNRNISRKVIHQISIREDFHVKAPFVKEAVDIYKRQNGADVPELSAEQIMILTMGRNMLNIDWMLVKKAKDFLAGNKKVSGFESIKDVIVALKYVNDNVTNLFRQENLRKDAWDYTEEQDAGRISVSAERVLKELSKSDQYEIVNKLEEKIIQGEISE